MIGVVTNFNAEILRINAVRVVDSGAVDCEALLNDKVEGVRTISFSQMVQSQFSA